MYVEERKTGYKFVETYTDPLTGKKRRVSVTLDRNTPASRKAAQKTLAAKIREMSEDILKPKEITFGELLDSYLASLKTQVTVSTATRNGFAMNYWERLIGRDTLVSMLPRLNILGMMERLGEPPKTMNERLCRFKAMVRWGYRAGHVESAEFLDRLQPFRVPPHKEDIAEKYLNLSEYKLLLPNLSVRKWRLLVEFLVLSGMRFGEAAALHVADVDFEAKVIHVTKTYDSVNKVEGRAKTFESNRDIHMQPQLLKVCRDIHLFMLRNRMKSKESLFFTDDRGGHISYYAFNMYLKENTLRHCGHQITVHALRHTSASLMFAQGFTEAEVARRLGHASSRITRDVYIHVTKELTEMDAKHLDTFVV